MCGIAGFIRYNQTESEAREIISEMSGVLNHRGPDDTGFYIDNDVALGHKRLSIIDLSTGKQPMHNEDKSVWLIMNGEIYNFQELRKDLESKGHRFCTRSDSEILIHLYEEEGYDSVKHLNGMFAFALWDKSKKTLFLGRDRIGKKPLHYAIVDGKLYFASEIKALLKHPHIERDLDLDSLSEYLTFEYIPAPNSIFKHIKKLLPGHILIFSKMNIVINSYWDITFRKSAQRIYSDENEVSKQLLKLLEESVKQRLMSDVPLGIFLSGGIDSSIITSLAARNSSEKIKTFSIGFKDASFDESLYAHAVSDYAGTEHHALMISAKDILRLIPCVGKIIDEPLADASIFPTYLLSQYARDYVTVVLAGDGGDELFAGYPTHLAHFFADKFYSRIPLFLRKYILDKAVNALPVSLDNFSFDFKAKKFISGFSFPRHLRHHIWMGSFCPKEKENLLLPSFRGNLDPERGFAVIPRILARCDSLLFQNTILYMDMKMYLHDDILVKVDRASMANSIEIREPFLDYKLIEFVTKLDFNLKMRRSRSKYILRKTAKGLIPQKIIDRPKKGFGIPISKWIKKELYGLVEETLSKHRISQGGLFNYSYIRQALKQHLDGKKDNRKLIWTLLIFELWRERFTD